MIFFKLINYFFLEKRMKSKISNKFCFGCFNNSGSKQEISGFFIPLFDIDYINISSKKNQENLL